MLSNISDRQYEIIAFSTNIFEATMKSLVGDLRYKWLSKLKPKILYLLLHGCLVKMCWSVCLNQFLVATSMVSLIQWTEWDILL